MQMNRRKTVLLSIVGVSITSLAVLWLRSNAEERETGVMPTMGDIPGTGTLFAGWDTSAPIRYVRLHRYRYEQYFVTGTTTKEAFIVLSAQTGWMLSEESAVQPPDDLQLAYQALADSPTTMLPWASDYWTLRGSNDKVLFGAGLNPRSGEFWASIVVQHGSSE